MKTHILSLAALLILACNSHPKEKVLTAATQTSIKPKDSLASDSTNQSYIEDLLTSKSLTRDGYTFKCGYLKYSTDSSNNPGFLQVYKNEKLIFTDSFEGEGEVFVDTLGYHNVSGRKLFFALHYGTEACDIAQYTRFYVISPENKIAYLNYYVTQWGGDGYSGIGFDHYFPEDSSGTANTFKVVESLRYFEHDHPDRFDTTNISFTGNEFTISKLTNNIGKATQ